MWVQKWKVIYTHKDTPCNFFPYLAKIHMMKNETINIIDPIKLVMWRNALHKGAYNSFSQFREDML